MNENTQTEVLLLMNIDNLKGTEQVKILAIVNEFLNSVKYMNSVHNVLNNIFSQPDFDFKTELPKIVLNVIKLNTTVDFRKLVTKDRSKYLIYGILYHYLVKNQTDMINGINISDLRLLFSNSWDLINVTTEIIKKPWYSFLSKFCCFYWIKSAKISV